MKNKKGPINGKVFTDEDWNDEATLTEGSYPYSKVQAFTKSLASENRERW